jgi:hypothetical protein
MPSFRLVSFVAAIFTVLRFETAWHEICFDSFSEGDRCELPQVIAGGRKLVAAEFNQKSLAGDLVTGLLKNYCRDLF